MTAEVCIMNKLAVALAADSALTLGSQSGEVKVYGSAEKIFQFSANAPVRSANSPTPIILSTRRAFTQVWTKPVEN